ncbi:GNAT family N-acetyltransferase [Streptomyces sp. NRRL F-5123]|uniref:GNAT family N-acetyltransferase n=1 Tax=Streptomyces sp. NRRL F-5123 TaxID=1463856 RepID=UPI00099D032D|nr:GNAT family N-acetyltransferase [Streptomyces sp. NRRL F-5123]
MTTHLPDAGSPRVTPLLPACAPALVPADGELPPRVRAVTDADLPELHRLDQEVFQQHAYPYFVLRQFYDLYRDDLLVVDDAGTLRGYVLAGTTSDPSRCWVLGLAIDRKCRHRGLGRLLMTESLRSLCLRGVREVWLTVEPANEAALDLYLSLGFSRVDRRRDYFGAGSDRVLMVLPLAGAVALSAEA